jgi:HAD superfamily hydrolase (TIGR01509 family)
MAATARKMTTGGVLFDLDGVLVDSASFHLRAYERVFAEAGLPFPDVARAAVTDGKARSHVIDLAAPSAPPSLKRILADAKPKALEALLDDPSDCSMPGATDTVRALASAGVPMAVVTNSRAPQIWLRKIGVATQLQAVVTGEDTSAPKPSPEGYLLGASRLGLDPRSCLAIEDSYDGWRAAKEAGMQVAVLGDQAPEWLDTGAELMRRLDASEVLRRLKRATALQ